MSFRHHDQTDLIGGVAGEDLRLSQYRAIVRDANGNHVRSGANGDIYGILENDPNVGQNTSVFIDKICPAVSGAAFARDAKLRSDASGRLVPAVASATAGDMGEAHYYRAEQAATAADQVVAVRRETGRV